MTPARIRILVSLTVIATGLAASEPAAPPSAARLERGQALYYQQCAACHGARLEGRFAPGISGEAFRARWAGREPELDRKVRATMPQGRAGSLPPEVYTDVIAFVLDFNELAPVPEVRVDPRLAP